MDRIVWDAALDVGDETVDGQHRQLVGLLDRLLDAHEASEDNGLIGDTLEQLSAYVSTHFACEQDLMRTHAMPEPDMRAHVEEHRLLSERTRGMVLEYRTGELTSVVPLVEFLHAWLVDHIERVDRRLVDHINAEKG